MSNEVALQADVGSIPSNSLTLLEKVKPLLTAISADNVDVFAVLQVASIGACFLVNGEFVDKVPELLVRSSSSLRIKRLSLLVGWVAGDTSSAMATTAAGRAASLLCNVLVERYDVLKTGEILHLLSQKSLPAGEVHSSCEQLSRVAAILSNKLSPLAFGSHLASQVTRIRHAYMDIGLPTPQTLLEHLSAETMAEFCFLLHRALHEEGLVLFVDGFFGLGNIVSFVTALCPHDVIVNVEGEVLFKGEKGEKVVSNIRHGTPTRITLGTILDGPKNPGFTIEKAESMFTSLICSNRKLERCLSDALDLLFIESDNFPEILSSVVEFITAVVFSFRGNELNPQDRDGFLRDGFKALLGPYADNRVRDKLSLYFGITPSMTSLDGDSASRSFLDLVEPNITSRACTSQDCHKPWQTLCTHCPVVSAWKHLCDIIGNAILLLFVQHAETKDWFRIMHGSQVGPTICTAALKRAGRDVGFNVNTPRWAFISSHSFHVDLLPFTGRRSFTSIGLCGEGNAIFPSSLLNPAVQVSGPRFTYIDADGQFYHEERFFWAIESCDGEVRAEAQSPVQGSISQSLSTHSSHKLTITTHLDTLKVRTGVQIFGRTIELSFLQLYLANMALSFAEQCDHDIHDDPTDPTIMPTSIAAPVANKGFHIACWNT
jgi:hypothetical protein